MISRFPHSYRGLLAVGFYKYSAPNGAYLFALTPYPPI